MQSQQNTTVAASHNNAQESFDGEYIVRVLECGAVVWEESDEIVLDI